MFNKGLRLQSTPPVWGATDGYLYFRAQTYDFNPRSPCGERHVYDRSTRTRVEFQSTLPVWGATQGIRIACLVVSISIHAPRVGSDSSATLERLYPYVFQSTLPVWGATDLKPRAWITEQFQSTLPVWGATGLRGRSGAEIKNFNPRSPCGERRVTCIDPAPGFIISIHAPRVGSDSEGRTRLFATKKFQSTLPVWGATL